MRLPSVCSRPLQPFVSDTADARHEDEGSSLHTSAQCSTLTAAGGATDFLYVLTAQPRLAVDYCPHLDLHPVDQLPVSSMIVAGRFGLPVVMWAGSDADGCCHQQATPCIDIQR